MELDKLNGSSIEEEIWQLKLSFAEQSAEFEIMSDWWWTDNDEYVEPWGRLFELLPEEQISIPFDFDDSWIDEEISLR